MTQKIHFESPILVLFNKVIKPGKASGDAHNKGGCLILQELLNKWVAEVVASDSHGSNLVLSAR